MTTSDYRSSNGSGPTLGPTGERRLVPPAAPPARTAARPTGRPPRTTTGPHRATMANKVSIPMVGQQGDLLVIDDEEYIIEQPTGATHYLTLQSVEDPERHERFASAGEFTDWWKVQRSVELVRAREHDEVAAEAETEEAEA